MRLWGGGGLSLPLNNNQLDRRHCSLLPVEPCATCALTRELMSHCYAIVLAVA